LDADELDTAVRTSAFAYLLQQQSVHGTVLPRTLLAKGFPFAGKTVHLMGPQGIFKPAILPDMPLSITTVPMVPGKPRPYEDEEGIGGLITYRYRGEDPHHANNVWLRTAMRRRVPMIYFVGIDEGLYDPVFPSYVVGEDPRELAFFVQADEHALLSVESGEVTDATGRRRYVTRLVQQRLHQEEFRVRVIRAYQTRCAVCRLRAHPELLDAAHILPDAHPLGQPVIPNGLSLCKLHHAAFDSNVIGIRPDYLVEVRRDVLKEHDGPMLLHGLQGMDKSLLAVPTRKDHRPNPAFLEERYELFRRAG
jgi:putative restriction endonuclease